MSENSQDYAQKPQLNCTFMNFASGQAKIFHRTGLNTFSHLLATVCTPLVTFFLSWRKSYQCIALRLKSSWYYRTNAGRGGGEGEGLVHGLNNYIGTKAKCRHLKKCTCKGTLVSGITENSSSVISCENISVHVHCTFVREHGSECTKTLPRLQPGFSCLFHAKVHIPTTEKKGLKRSSELNWLSPCWLCPVSMFKAITTYQVTLPRICTLYVQCTCCLVHVRPLAANKLYVMQVNVL